MRRPLAIKKLHDYYDLDLDLAYIVGDVFKDRDSGIVQSSIVKVLQAPSARESSLPAQSALRPHLPDSARRKRPWDRCSTCLRDGITPIKQERDGATSDGVNEGRKLKRARLEQIERSPSPRSDDPDQPLQSREDTFDIGLDAQTRQESDQRADVGFIDDTCKTGRSHSGGKPATKFLLISCHN